MWRATTAREPSGLAPRSAALLVLGNGGTSIDLPEVRTNAHAFLKGGVSVVETPALTSVQKETPEPGLDQFGGYSPARDTWRYYLLARVPSRAKFGDRGA